MNEQIIIGAAEACERFLHAAYMADAAGQHGHAANFRDEAEAEADLAFWVAA